MKRTFLALALAAAMGAGAIVQSQQGPTPTKLGSVDMGRVFEQYRKRADIEAELDAQTDLLEDKYKADRAKIEAGADELATLNVDSQAYADLRRRLDVMQFQLKYDKDTGLRGVERSVLKQKALLYKEIVNEIGAYAEDRGYAAVFLDVPLGADFHKRGDFELITSTRSVIWADRRLDITNDVIRVLNASLPPK